MEEDTGAAGGPSKYIKLIRYARRVEWSDLCVVVRRRVCVAGEREGKCVLCVLPPLTSDDGWNAHTHHTAHSAEGHEFVVDRKCACVSKTIDAMLAGASCPAALSGQPPSTPSPFSCLWDSPDTTTPPPPGNFAESSKGEIRFPEISTPILEKVIQYLYYKVRSSPGAAHTYTGGRH